MDMSMSHDFARIKINQRRASAMWQALFWLFCTLIFASWGGYVMYSSMGIKSILCGFLLLICAVVTTILAICSTLDMTGD